MFAKSTLVSAVAAALGVTAVGIQTAQADSVFFPYVGVGETVTTVITTINTSTRNRYNEQIGKQGPYLHYRLFFKAGDAARTAACTEVDEFHPTSKFDIQTFDLSGHFGADTQAVLFNDPSQNNQYVADGRTFAMGSPDTTGTNSIRGYLLIDNGDTVGGTLAGEAFAFEFANGAVWGYQAKQKDGFINPTTGEGRGGDYRLAASMPADVSIQPFDETATAFFVTPVSAFQAAPLNNYVARVGFQQTYYDRDERPFSSGKYVDITCVGRVETAELLSDAGARIPDGGWASIYNYRLKGGTKATWAAGVPDDDATSLVNTTGYAWPGAVVIKLEYNIAATFNGEAVDGVFNNGYILAPRNYTISNTASGLSELSSSEE